MGQSILKKNVNIYHLFYFLIIFCISINPVSAVEYYVDISGDNNDTGLSPESAWATPSYAVTKVVPGDTIYLMEGTWFNEKIVPAISGTVEMPITIKSFDEKATLDGGEYSYSSGIGITLQNVNYWNIDDIIFTNYSTGVLVSGSSHCNISNSVFYKMYTSSVIFSNSQHSSMVGNDVSYVRWNSIQIKGTTPSTTDIHITGNLVHHGIDHGLTDLMGNFSKIYIEDNLYRDCSYSAIYVHQTSVSGYDDSGFVYINNNTMFNVPYGIYLDDPIDDSVISNNNIYGISDASDGHHIKVSDLVTNLTVSNNTLTGDAGIYQLQVNSKDSSFISNKIIADSGDVEYRFLNGVNTIVNPLTDDKRYFKVTSSSDFYVNYTFGKVFEPSSGTAVYYPAGSSSYLSDGTASVIVYDISLLPKISELNNLQIIDYDLDNNNYEFSVESSTKTNPTDVNVYSNVPNSYFDVYVDGLFYTREISASDGLVTFNYKDEWDARKIFSFQYVQVEAPVSSGTGISFTPSATSLTATSGESTTFSVETSQEFTSAVWSVDGDVVESSTTEHVHSWTTAGTHTVTFDGTADAGTISRSWVVIVSTAEYSSISISPSTTTVAPGESFSLDVYIDPTQALTGSQFDLQYSQLASISTVDEGDLFTASGLATTFQYDSISNAEGLLDNVYAAIVGSGTITSPGVMATIEMVAGSSSGIMDIGLTNVILSDANSNPAGYTVSDATVLIDTAPQFTTISAKTVEEKQSLSFTTTATDADGDDLSYTATSLPSGATFNGGSFSWTPSEGDAGSYVATFEVTDGYLTDTVNVSITVTPMNHIPEITLFEPADGSTFEEGSIIGVNVAATDADGDSLSYTIEIDGVQVSTSTSYSWTTDYESAGTHTIRVTVSDGTDEVSSSGTITITDLQPRWDVNEDGIVNVLDITLVGQNYGQTYTGELPRWDVNQDGTVNIQDLSIVSGHFGETV